MEYTKQPITLAEQINILKQRGLIFEDEEQAIAVLNHISYFRLASYWRVMEENNRIHRFRNGTIIQGGRGWKLCTSSPFF